MAEGSSVDKIELCCDDSAGETNVGLNLTSEIMEEENEFEESWNSNFEDSIDRRAANALNIQSVRELLHSPRSTKEKAGAESLIGVMFSALTSDIRSAACSLSPSTSRCSSRQSLQSNTSRNLSGWQRTPPHHPTSTPRNATQEGDRKNKSSRHLDKIEQLYQMDLLPDARDDSVLTEPELQAVFGGAQQHTMDLLSAAGKLQERRDAHGGYGTPSSYASETEMNLYFDNQQHRDISSSSSDATPTKERQQSGSSTDTGVDSELSENICYVEDPESYMAFNSSPLALAVVPEKEQPSQTDSHNMQMLSQAVSKCEQSIAHLELFASITDSGASNRKTSYSTSFTTKTPKRRRSFESPVQRNEIPKTMGSTGRLRRMLETASSNMIDEDISKAVLLNLTTPDRSRARACRDSDSGLEQFTAFQSCLQQLLAEESPTKQKGEMRLNRSRSLDDYSDVGTENDKSFADLTPVVIINSPTSNERCSQQEAETALLVHPLESQRIEKVVPADRKTTDQSKEPNSFQSNSLIEDITKDTVADAVDFINRSFEGENDSIESLSSESPVPTARNLSNFNLIENSSTSQQQNNDYQSLTANVAKTNDDRSGPPLVEKAPTFEEHESPDKKENGEGDCKENRNKELHRMNYEHFALAVESNCESETESGYSTTTFSEQKSVKAVSDNRVTTVNKTPHSSDANEVSTTKPWKAADCSFKEARPSGIDFPSSESLPETKRETLSLSDDEKNVVDKNTAPYRDIFEPSLFADTSISKLGTDKWPSSNNEEFKTPEEKCTFNVPTEKHAEKTIFSNECETLPKSVCEINTTKPCSEKCEALVVTDTQARKIEKLPFIEESMANDETGLLKTFVSIEEKYKNRSVKDHCTTENIEPDNKQVKTDFKVDNKEVTTPQVQGTPTRARKTRTVHFEQPQQPTQKDTKKRTLVDPPTITQPRKTTCSMPYLPTETLKLSQTPIAKAQASQSTINAGEKLPESFNTPTNAVTLGQGAPRAPKKNPISSNFENRYKDLDKKIDRILNSTVSPTKQTTRGLDSRTGKNRLGDLRRSREALRHSVSTHCCDPEETTVETKGAYHVTRRNIFCEETCSEGESGTGATAVSVRSEKIAKSVDELVDDTAVKLGEQFLSSASPEMSSAAADLQAKGHVFEDDAVSSVTKALQSIKLNLKREKESADKLQENVMKSRQRIEDLDSLDLADSLLEKKIPSSMDGMGDKPGSSKVRTLEEVVILLKKHVQQRELEINVLGKQLNESNARIKKMEKKLNEKSLDEYRMKGLQQDKDDLYKRLNDLLNDRDHLQTKIGKITRQKEDAEVATKKAKEDLQLEKDRRHILSKSADRYPEDDKRHSHELKERVDELELLNKSSASELDRAERELSSLKRENRSLRMSNEHDLVELKADHTVMREKLDRMHEISAENLLLHTDVADYQKELSELRDEARVLRSKCYELSEENRQCKAEIRDLRRYMDLMRANKSGDTRQDLLNKIEYYQMEHDRLLDEVRHLKQRLGDVSPRSPRMRSSSPKQGSRHAHTTPSKQSVRFSNSLERGRSPVSDAMAASTASSFAASRVRKDRSLSPSAALNVRDLTMDRYGRHMEGPESRQFECIDGRESPRSDDSDCTEFLLKPQPQVNGRSAAPPAGIDSDDDDVELHITSLRNGKGSNSSSSTQIGLRSGSNERIGSSPNRRSRSPCSPVGFRSCSPRLTSSQKCVNDTARDRYPTQMKRSLPRRAFAPRNPSDIKLGYCIKFTRPGGKLSRGTVRYIGHLPTRSEIFVGVELDGHDGKHSGTYQGTKYFTCPTNKGVFTPFSKVIMAWE